MLLNVHCWAKGSHPCVCTHVYTMPLHLTIMMIFTLLWRNLIIVHDALYFSGVPNLSSLMQSWNDQLWGLFRLNSFVCGLLKVGDLRNSFLRSATWKLISWKRRYSSVVMWKQVMSVASMRGINNDCGNHVTCSVKNQKMRCSKHDNETVFCQVKER